MKTTEITLLIFDTKENFSKPNIQMQYGGDTLFKELFCFTNQVEFKMIIENFTPDEKFIIVCHINYEDYSGFFNFRNTNIKTDFNVDNHVTYVSSGDSGEVMKQLFEKHKVSEKVILYSQLISSIEKGEIKPLSKKDLRFKEETASKKNNKIFLSHSSLDSDIVMKFRDIILVQGLKCDTDSIKFTSDESTGIPGGIDIPGDLNDFLANETGLFIQFLSDNYKKSRVCLNEEGAGWILLKELMFIPVLLPGYSHTSLSWIKSNSKGISISNKESLLNIYEHRREFFSKNVNITVFNQKIDEFIKSI